MKSTNIKTGLTILLIVLIIVGIIVSVKTISGKKENKENETVEIGKVFNIRETTKELPEFFLETSKPYKSSLGYNDLKEAGVKFYEFEINLNSGFRTENIKFTGLRLKDYLDTIVTRDYIKIGLNDSNGNITELAKEEIDEDVFFVIYKNDDRLEENGSPTLFIPDRPYISSVRGVTTIDFYTEPMGNKED